jgi:hypothetical protein
MGKKLLSWDSRMILPASFFPSFQDSIALVFFSVPTNFYLELMQKGLFTVKYILGYHGELVRGHDQRKKDELNKIQIPRKYCSESRPFS